MNANLPHSSSKPENTTVSADEAGATGAGTKTYSDFSVEQIGRAQHVLRFIIYLFQQYRDNNGILNASALTYTTLFAVVPLMTVTYAVLSSIASFQGVGAQIESLLFDHFVPSSGVAVGDYLSNFASKAQSLTGVGIGFLAVTAYLMLRTVEGAFNRIWRVRKPRRGISSFLLYWAVLSLGPILLGLGFVLTSYIASLPLISDATQGVDKAGLLKFVTLVSNMAAFTLIYAAVPNCHVPIKHAAIGALAVAILFETAKQGFTLFVTHFPSYELIYGAFAAVPLFLFWIFISWSIVLLGAELVRALSYYRSQYDSPEYHGLSGVLLVLEQFWLAQHEGRTLKPRHVVEALPGLSRAGCDSLLDVLQRVRLIELTERGGYVLSRDLNRFELDQLCRDLPWKLPDQFVLSNERRWMGVLDTRLQQQRQARRNHLGVTLANLFDDKSGHSDVRSGKTERSTNLE